MFQLLCVLGVIHDNSFVLGGPFVNGFQCASFKKQSHYICESDDVLHVQSIGKCMHNTAFIVDFAAPSEWGMF